MVVLLVFEKNYVMVEVVYWLWEGRLLETCF